MIPKDLEQAARILKWLNGSLQMGEISLKYMEQKMSHEYSQSNWNQLELNSMRITLYCTVHSMMIWFTSFEKEYNGQFHAAALAFNREDQIALRRNCAKYIDLVHEIFPNLKKIRNTILAHGYRWKDDRSLSDKEIDDYMNEITNRGSLLEYYQLSNTSNLIFQEIEKTYGEINADLDIEEPDDLYE